MEKVAVVLCKDEHDGINVDTVEEKLEYSYKDALEVERFHVSYVPIWLTVVENVKSLSEIIINTFRKKHQNLLQDREDESLCTSISAIAITSRRSLLAVRDAVEVLRSSLSNKCMVI